MKEGACPLLVLTRKRDETIVFHVGEVEVTVCVVEIRGDKVRLGTDAPRDVHIRRSELPADVIAAFRRRQGHGFDAGPVAVAAPPACAPPTEAADNAVRRLLAAAEAIERELAAFTDQHGVTEIERPHLDAASRAAVGLVLQLTYLAQSAAVRYEGL